MRSNLTDVDNTGTGKVVLFANTDWYLFNFRLSLAEALRDAGYDVLMLSPPGAYGEQLRSLGFSWQALPMDRRSLNPIQEIRLLSRLVHYLKSEKPNIVHGFTIKAAIYGAIAGKFAGVPAIINSVNGLGYVFISSDLKARLLRPVVRLMMRFAFSGKTSRVIVQNPADKAQFVTERIVPGSSIDLIPGSGVDCKKFAPLPSQDVPDNRLRVLLPARLLWDKGIGEFVEASRIASGRGIRFLVAGEVDGGNPAAVDAELAGTWQQEGLLELLGHVDDMPGLMQNVDVVVLPSYREGLPKSLIEAAASAKPVITTDVPGCRDVVEDGVSGLIVPVKDSIALADAIIQLAENPDLRRKMGKAGRERARRLFEQKIIVRQTIAVYENAVRGSDG